MRSWSRNTNGNARGQGGWRGRRGEGQERTESGLNDVKRVCNFVQRGQTCRFGSQCRFSHDLSSGGRDQQPGQRHRPAEETPEQVQVRTDYNSWKRMIKQEPRQNDGQTAERLWRGALEILNGKDKDWKHSLAKDLDDDEFYGRSHIRETIACAVAARNPRQDYDAMKYFLQAMTHASILDCLSIDTCVGGLYNFFSGANGSRAVPALQRFCDSVLAKLPDVLDEDWADLESAAVALSTALREVLKREQRARLHDDLAHLIDSMHGLATSLQGRGFVGASAQLLHHVGEIRAVVGRARGLLSVDDAGAPDFADTPASAFPRVLHPPGGRHDNDNSDIAVIKIFPTRAEILSEAAEFLPSTDLEQPHFLSDKSQRHIDTLFRLLRQDTFGELKDVLASTLRLAEANRSHLDSPKLSFGNLRANRYSQAIISYMSFDSRRGLEADISFSQPRNLRDKTAADRQRWWEESRRLSEGVLVSFIAAHQGRVQHLFLITSQKKTKNSEDENLTKQGHRATITLRLTSHAQEDIETLMGLSSSRAQGVLVEFPGVIPATFMSVLENMQNMQRLGAFPFQDWILPEKTKQGFGDTTANIPPPRYARKPGFAFSLKPILKGCNLGKADLLIAPDSIADREALIGEVEAETDLDRGQCRALVAALCREFALIQGPPGTGKSYLGIKLMNILLNCQGQAELGPIVVVCYTNHALDQFLEHILKYGTKKVIRIGGQSHSAVLEGHNLRAVTQSESKSRFERYSLAMSYQDLDAAAESIEKILGRAHGALRHIRWENMQKYLSRYHPHIAAQFAETDEDGFEIVGRHPFDIWASLKTDVDVTQDHGGETEIDSDAVLRKASISVNSLSASERQHLMDLWSMDRYKHAVDDLVETIEGTSTEQQQVSNIHDEVDRRVLQEADVIGITTTGLAKRISTLQRLKCKVVICEEAGEVMEPHILSALLPTVEHIIQIGDHEQLRPQINNFGLSLESKQGMLYQLDRSQFERLSVGISGRPKIPLAQLEVQRRMRPSISSLVRETLYPNIQDHPSTCDLPDVVGMRKNLFWLDHSHLEAGESAEMHHKSHSNDWEVGLVHALVRHIVRQGVYSSSDIAVLTPYTGQLQKLRTSMRNDFEVILSDRDQDALNRDGIDSEEPDSQEEAPSVQRKGALAKKKLSDLLRVATVDNFQGEEAKVVIVSLVRSNNARKVGFLKTTNRINVLLSRAQHGMYLIGNAETYTNVKMWQTVIELMRASVSVGKVLALCCPRHKEMPINVSKPDDFSRHSPEGGCSQTCSWRLADCGHMCLARCHSESMHNIFSCPQPCQRLHEPCGHGCQRPTCGEDCGKCLVPLRDVELPCGHVKDTVACHSAQNPESIRCDVIVEKVVPDCNHNVNMACFKSVTAEGYRCPAPCSTPLSCGHICPGTCGSCRVQADDTTGKILHRKCRKICERPFGTCNHHCRKPCHAGTECGLCVAPCEVRCQHSTCAATCSEGCTPCVEKCEWSCEHQGTCAMPCSATCTRLPCNERCAKLLSCGHRCPGICGEVCPEDLCKDCGESQDSRVDLLEMKTYTEIDVDVDPIVVLGCGHFFTAETLDGLVGMHTAYVSDVEGRFTGLVELSGEFAKMPQCPDCKRPVRQYATRRYNRIVNRAVADESARRFLVAGKEKLRNINMELEKLQGELAGSHSGILRIINVLPAGQIGTLGRRLQIRYGEHKKLRHKIKTFCNESSERYQPHHKLYEATIHALRGIERNSLSDGLAALSMQSPPRRVERDCRVALAGEMALVKLDFIILEDMFDLLPAIEAANFAQPPKWPGGSPLLVAKLFLKSCSSLISRCRTDALPKLAVEAILYHARMAHMYGFRLRLDEADRAKASGFLDEARENLETASRMCEQPFQDADTLKEAVCKIIQLLQAERYEAVSPEEIAAIKKAMLSGRDGMATHSGHWYNCVNGHPFAIGECGMPMEQARCPECGAPIGGQNHQSVAGVTRADAMEN
ncbi:NFX1-type zinc finger-containing protein 1 [Beauveria bassiana D1-5]|uniref:NFX1-type zinc finger-containing protein 1 n=1 Tax=Beauveria bassiana D1-5 TaxID=1245745 RepID=A0A0A2VK74_BEABA|nr:NFX1-type zinc finger-containing protein 1 [Beauveria bassiana D1-5]